MKIKHLKRIFFFFLGLILMIGVFSCLFYPKTNQVESGVDHLTANGILGEPENTIDLLFVGDSISYSSINPLQIWQEYGYTSYVCGSSAQPLYDSLYFIRKSLKNQSPSAVVLEANTIFQPFTLRQYLGERMKDYLPLVRYHNSWKTNSLTDYVGPVQYNWINDFKGHRVKTGVAPGKNPDYMTYSENITPIPDASLFVLEQITELCRENAVSLYLINAPCMYYWNYEKHNAVSQYAQEQNIPYLDLNLLNDQVGIDWNTDTLDQGDHMNRQGAEKVTAYLGNYFKQELGLSDRRSDPRYSHWDQSVQIVLAEENPEKASKLK